MDERYSVKASNSERAAENQILRFEPGVVLACRVAGCMRAR